MSDSLAAEPVASSKRGDDLSTQSLELMMAFFAMTPDQRRRVQDFVKEVIGKGT